LLVHLLNLVYERAVKKSCSINERFLKDK